MSESKQAEGPGPPEQFLLAEYDGLIEIDKARNERLDRFLTIFLTLAASPWAVYTLVLKDEKSGAAFRSVPLPVALAFVLTGVLGFLVTMMFIQVRFNIILYMRAMNTIRGHFATAGNIRPALRLPTRGDVPPYYEKGSYILVAVIGMGLLNSIYVGFGLYYISAQWLSFCGQILVSTGVGLGWEVCHVYYYRQQALQRDRRDQASDPGGLKFAPGRGRGKK